MELVSALCAETSVEKVIVLLPKPPSTDLLSYFSAEPKIELRISDVESDPSKGWFKELKWIQYTIPRLLRNSGSQSSADWLICPYHQTPVALRKSVRALTIIHDLCGLEASSGYRRFGRGYLQHMFNFYTGLWRTNVFVTISKYTRDALIERFPSTRERAAPPVLNAVRAARLSTQQATRLMAGLPPLRNGFFLAYAAPGPRKGTDVTIRAWKAYRDQGGTADLVCIGSKWGIREWSGFAEESGVQGITWLMGITNEQRDSLYYQARCLVFPSRCEGFGYPILEALRQGCPVIASKRSPADEICEDVLPLLESISEDHVATAMHHYDALSDADRSPLREVLFRQSMKFANSDLGRGFAQIMQSSGG